MIAEDLGGGKHTNNYLAVNQKHNDEESVLFSF
jgi:hypothetical protein